MKDLPAVNSAGPDARRFAMEDNCPFPTSYGVEGNLNHRIYSHIPHKTHKQLSGQDNNWKEVNENMNYHNIQEDIS